MVRLTVNLVTYNGAKYLSSLFDSLKQQTFRDWTINVFDNNSADETVKILKDELDKLVVQYQFVIGKENIGFAAAHNQLFKRVESEYVLVLNQDVRLEPDCLAKLVVWLDQNPAVAVVSPRLMRWQDGRIIDSLGLRISRNRRVVDRLAGQIWTDFDECAVDNLKRNKQVEVFGVSAACAIYNYQVLQRILLADGQLFDGSYFAYKEDVDLAYRLRTAGWRSFVLLDAVAYHDRSVSGAANGGYRQAVKNKSSQSKLVKYHSYKNHLAALYKNEYWQNFVLDLPWILWYELKKFVYFLLFDRVVLRGWCHLWQDRVRLKEQKKIIKNARQLNWREIRRWWS